MAVPVVHSHLHQALMVSISIWPLHDHRWFDVVWLCDKVLVLHFPVHWWIYNCPLIQLTGIVRWSFGVDIHCPDVLVEILGIENVLVCYIVSVRFGTFLSGAEVPWTWSIILVCQLCDQLLVNWHWRAIDDQSSSAFDPLHRLSRGHDHDFLLSRILRALATSALVLGTLNSTARVTHVLRWCWKTLLI